MKINPLAWLLALGCALVILAMPRFNRNDWGLQALTAGGKGMPGDSIHYTNMVSFFRQELGVEKVRAPYSYRPLVPFLASVLPFRPMTSINILNLVSMLATMGILHALLKKMELPCAFCLAGCGLFVFSFPTFYYATIGYVDPVLVFLLMTGLLLVFNEAWGALALLVGVGAFVKESIVILLLVQAVYLFYDHCACRRKWLFLGVTGVAFATGILFARRWIPVAESYGWTPSMDRLAFNLTRPRTWLSFILTFGIPGVIACYFPFLKHFPRSTGGEKQTAALLAGCLSSLALFGYAMISAYADGRFVWISYPFSIPLAVMVLYHYRNMFGKIKGCKI